MFGSSLGLSSWPRAFRSSQRRPTFGERCGTTGCFRSGSFRPVAAWLPRLELVLALVLLAGVATAVSAALAAAALLVFSAAVAVNLARGRKIECGCFGGASPRQITWRLVLRDILLAATAVAISVRPPATWTLLDWPNQTSGAGSARDAVAIVLAVLSAVVIEQLLADGVDATAQCCLVSASCAFRSGPMSVPWIVALAVLSTRRRPDRSRRTRDDPPNEWRPRAGGGATAGRPALGRDRAASSRVRRCRSFVREDSAAAG